MHALHAAAMRGKSRCGVDAGRVDAGMPQHVRQLDNILSRSVKSAGKKMAQVVGKNLGREDAGTLTQSLHFPPYGNAVNRPAAPGDEHRSGGDAQLGSVLQQQRLQLPDEQNGAHLALAAHHGFPLTNRFHRNMNELADADAGDADGLQNELQASDASMELALATAYSSAMAAL